MIRFTRPVIVLVALVLAYLCGWGVPVVLAAGPVQVAPSDAQLAQSLNALLGLLLSLVLGGAGAYALDQVPRWRDWKEESSPVLREFPFLKGLLVLVGTACVGALLTGAQVFANVAVLSQLPDWLKAGLAFACTYLASQVVWNHSLKATRFDLS